MKEDWTQEVWESWCDVPRNKSNTISLRDVLLFGEACHAKGMATAEESNNKLRKALEVIRNSPGGGPGRRIAEQALGSIKEFDD